MFALFNTETPAPEAVLGTESELKQVVEDREEYSSFQEDIVPTILPFSPWNKG